MSADWHCVENSFVCIVILVDGELKSVYDLFLPHFHTGRTRGASVKYPRAPLPGSGTALKAKAAAAAAKGGKGQQDELAGGSEEGKEACEHLVGMAAREGKGTALRSVDLQVGRRRGDKDGDHDDDDNDDDGDSEERR